MTAEAITCPREAWILVKSIPKWITIGESPKKMRMVMRMESNGMKDVLFSDVA